MFERCKCVRTARLLSFIAGLLVGTSFIGQAADPAGQPADLSAIVPTLREVGTKGKALGQRQAGLPAVALGRRRVALFNEPGFPSQSPRPADWYRQVLTNAGYQVSVIGINALRDTNAITTARVDVVFLAAGGCVPLEAEEALDQFMRQGGTIAIDGHIMIGRPAYPSEIQAEYSQLATQYAKGEACDEYHDFIWKQGLSQGNAFCYDQTLKRWITPVGSFSYASLTGRMVPGFELIPWPNHVSTAHYYHRPLNEDLQLNPVLAQAGLAQGMPAILPGSSGDGLLRLQLPGRSYAAVHECANDVLIPVYVFSNVSQRAYSSFPKAGRDAKDRDSDFYVYRSHTAWKNGFTLLHFGVSGAQLLRSDQGASALLAGLTLSASSLPGERSPEFIATCHRLEAELSRYYGAVLETMDALTKVAGFYHYQGKAIESQEAVAALSKLRGQYERISQEGRQSLSAMEEGAGHQERLALCRLCNDLSGELEGILMRCASTLTALPVPAEPPAVTNRFKQLMLGFRYIEPAGVSRLKAMAPLLRQMGMTMGPYYVYGSSFADAVRLYQEADVCTGYHVSYPTTRHFARRSFEDGQLDPALGTVKSYKTSWFDTASDWEAYERDVRWLLKKVNERQEIGYVVYLSERNLDWSLWGKRMEGRFQKYLQLKHGAISNLNQTWGSAYQQFADVHLPTQRPVTQPDHALWEDWTRYREIYYEQEEVIPLAQLVAKYASNCWSLAYGSYNLHHLTPANGINFYELGKVLGYPSTFEMQASTKAEILAADIAGFHHRNLTAEWGAFYFAPAAEPDQTDLLKQEIWKGIGWGQIGLHTFVGIGIPERSHVRWMSANVRMLPVGWQMKIMNRDMRRFSHILLDGQRREPAVRILYSPTTRRHTSWPGGEGDTSLEEVEGWYMACQTAHIPARAIDEGAIVDGFLPSAVRLLIVPQTTYLNNRLLDHILKFVEQGGCLLITPDSGRYDEYGHRADALVSRASVAAARVKDPIVALGASQYLAPTAYREKIAGLQILFQEQTKEVAQFKNGEAAVTLTRCGKGTIMVCGLPFGQLFRQEWRQAPGPALALLRRMVGASGVPIEYECSDPLIAIWPWQYQGKRYLLLTSRTRTELVKVEDKGGVFPFQRPPPMTPFTLKISGHVQVKDYLLDTPLPVTVDGADTVIAGLIASPGGAVYELQGSIPSSSATNVTWADRNQSKLRTPNIQHPTSNEDQKNSFANQGITNVSSLSATLPFVALTSTNRALPFHGRLFSDEGDITLGDYQVSMGVDSLGGAWGGDFYLRVERDGEIIRKRCQNGETVLFPFLQRALKVVCADVSTVMPVSIQASFSEQSPPLLVAGCSLVEEPFRGQSSLVLKNEYLKIRVLPHLGGRIIEFISKSDGENHSHCQGDGSALAGGLKENAGAYPGPFINAVFDCAIVTNTPEEVRILLKTPSLEKQFALKRGEAKLATDYKLFNRQESQGSLKLRTHPEMTVGGDVSAADSFYYPTVSKVAQLPFLVGRSTPFFANEGEWLAVFDMQRKKGLIQMFRRTDVAQLYVCMGENFYSFEATTPPKEVNSGECLSFDCQWGILQGLSGIAGFAEDVGVNIVTSGAGVYGRNEAMQIQVEAGSLVPRAVEARIRIEGDGTTFDLGKTAWTIRPEKPIRELRAWNTGEYADGQYTIVVEMFDPAGRKFLTAIKEFRLAGRQQTAMNAEVGQWRARLQQKTETCRQLQEPAPREQGIMMTTRIAILLNELEAAIAANDTAATDSLKQEIDRLFRQLCELGKMHVWLNTPAPGE